MYCCENLPHSYDFESDISELVNQFYGDSNEIKASEHAGGSLKTCSYRSTINGVPEKKSMAALKSHSEAERRRRERINGHMAALRDFVPNSEKMEKATLLAEVINQVEQLRKKAKQASQGLNIPTDTNELEVKEVSEDPCNNFLLKASLCCDYRTDLFSDVRQALTNLPVRILKSEVSTLGGRIKVAFLIVVTAADKEVIASRLRTALGNILDKVSADEELFFPPKPRRVVSYLDS